VTDLFNYVTGYSAKTEFRKLLVAPINLRQKLEDLIRREISHAERGEPAKLIFKMNGLEDGRYDSPVVPGVSGGCFAWTFSSAASAACGRASRA